MPSFLKQYGETEGPLGLPMNDKQARAIDQLLKALPQEDRQLVRMVTTKAPSELLDGEHADVSWITTETIDRDKEIVIAKGMNDSQFAHNPLVTMQHCYEQPPIGRSLWRKKSRDGSLVGIKAKTQYPAKPDDWPGDCWPPDTAFSLIKAGLLLGKSIGFLRLKSHTPSSSEIAARPELVEVRRIIDEWLLLEYSCTFLPTNADALVQAVSKSHIQLPAEWKTLLGLKDHPAGEWPSAENLRAPAAGPADIPFTPLSSVEEMVRRKLASIDVRALIKHSVQEASGRLQGRV
jgi:hypothetical protein